MRTILNQHMATDFLRRSVVQSRTYMRTLPLKIKAFKPPTQALLVHLEAGQKSANLGRGLLSGFKSGCSLAYHRIRCWKVCRPYCHETT